MSHTSAPLPSRISDSIFAMKRMAPDSPRLKRPVPYTPARANTTRTMIFFIGPTLPCNNSAISYVFTISEEPYADALSRGAADRDVGKLRQHFVANGIAPRLHPNQTRT